MKAKIINTCLLVTALLSAGSLNCLALDYDEAYAQISAQFSSQSSDLGNYDALKAQLPDVSGSFNIMSQADLDATMNSYSAEIQSKYQSSINSAQANAQSSSAEAMANISARAQSIQSGIDPDTGEAYSDYIANNTPSYDADAWLASATANLSSNISTLRGIVGDAEMPENQLWAEVQDNYYAAVDSYNSMVADHEASGELGDFITTTFGDNATDEQKEESASMFAGIGQYSTNHSYYQTEKEKIYKPSDFSSKQFQQVVDSCNATWGDNWGQEQFNQTVANEYPNYFVSNSADVDVNEYMLW